jgi:hypothetical protein
VRKGVHIVDRHNESICTVSDKYAIVAHRRRYDRGANGKCLQHCIAAALTLGAERKDVCRRQPVGHSWLIDDAKDGHPILEPTLPNIRR